jgi:Ca-activated chloride channel family protein
MQDEDKLPMAKKSMHLLVDQLDERDSVAIATYAGADTLVLPSTNATNKARIHDAIDRLQSGGGTNMGSGMELAYREAGKHVGGGMVSRVIVLSDGDANIGHTSYDQILASIKGYVSEGVTLSTVGFGNGNYNDNLMEQLADAGNGNYSYIDSMKAARKVFVDDLTGTLQVIAKDVKVQVEFDPAVVGAYRLVGYENRDVADRDFRNDKVDAGEIGAGHTVTALYEVALKPGASTDGALCTVHLRSKAPRAEKATETQAVFTTSRIQKRFADLTADTRFAAAVGVASEILRGSPYAAKLTLEDARAMAAEAADGKYAAERQELVNLLSRAPAVATR